MASGAPTAVQFRLDDLLSGGDQQDPAIGDAFQYDESGNQMYLPDSRGFQVLIGHLPQWQANKIYTDGSFY